MPEMYRFRGMIRVMRRRPKKILTGIGLGVVLCLLLGLAGGGIVYASTALPEFPAQSLTTQLRYSDGTQFATFATENRVEVALDDVPPHVRNAVVAAEDAGFWSNGGVSLRGTGRAIWGLVTGDPDAGGGSTITQQYVRNALDLTRGRSYTRKAKEIILAQKLSRSTTKHKILEGYLNTIYFGRGAWGVQSAAKAYFGTSVDRLDIAEAAVLAAVIKDPTNFDPQHEPVSARGRWAYVLDRMAANGFLTAAQRAEQTYPTSAVLRDGPASTTAWRAGSTGVLGRRIEQELLAIGFSEQKINTGGLIVETTIRRSAQQAAARISRQYVNGNVQDPRMATAMVSIDPATGAVLAYYGGERGYGNLDLASAQAPHPAGSSFKAYVLAAGIEDGYGIDSRWNGLSGQTLPGRSTPLRNSGDDSSCGTQCSLTDATVKSLNTVYWALTEAVGVDAVAATAKAVGIRTLDGAAIDTAVAGGINAGIGIGQYAVTVLDQASGYATLAANGVHREPYFIDRVLAPDGRTVLWDHATRGAPATRAFPPDVARDLNYVLEQVYESSTKNRIGRPAAFKTGTQQLRNTSENAHAWLCGFTPQLATAVWVGSGSADYALRDEANGNIRVYGSGIPGSIWRDFMKAALKGQEIRYFADPVWSGSKSGNAPSSAPAPWPNDAPADPPTAGTPDGSATPTGAPADEGGGDPTAPDPGGSAPADADQGGTEPEAGE